VGASTNFTDGGDRLFLRRGEDFVVVAMEMPESRRVRIDLMGVMGECTVEEETIEDTLCRAREAPPSEGDRRGLE